MPGGLFELVNAPLQRQSRSIHIATAIKLELNEHIHSEEKLHLIGWAHPKEPTVPRVRPTFFAPLAFGIAIGRHAFSTPRLTPMEREATH